MSLELDSFEREVITILLGDNKLMRMFFIAVLALFSFESFALEKKDISDVSISDIVTDIQAQAEGAGDNHLSLVWWVPYEYWLSVFSREDTVPDAIKNEMLDVLKKYMVVGVVQADISPIGSFDFYSKDTVMSGLSVFYRANDKKEISLSPEKDVSGEMTLIMEQISPILKGAMGNMGANFHFFVYRDVNKDGERLIDPYKNGKVRVNLKNRESKKLSVGFEAPLNSLFVPRLCPNGKEAHVSWSYCPWSGKKL